MILIICVIWTSLDIFLIIRKISDNSAIITDEEVINFPNIADSLYNINDYIKEFIRVVDSIDNHYEIKSLNNPGYILFAVSPDSSGYIFYDYLTDCSCGENKSGVLRLSRTLNNKLIPVFYKEGVNRVPYIISNK